ncbi:hypothetical protein [Pelagicoccus sp. SDUM812005]|uniref:hypothetical protein n=1 Tax=Pelagicoccus sp. SDUM812005 TaxID=3041257 RepID=UPI00280E0463|nr:hypothetical protein [Pelagicoccus sp. SDUM812005]MDQ8183832.1 hypothetical protein [Pelagicoccus sp. SDUM812005]
MAFTLGKKIIKIPMTKIGAVLVLLASLFELTIERQLKESNDSAQSYKLEEKIDAIWFLLAHEYSHKAENQDEPWVSTNFADSNDLFFKPRNHEKLKKQLRYVTNTRITVQLVGGLLILFSSFIKKEKPNQPCDTTAVSAPR